MKINCRQMSLCVFLSFLSVKLLVFPSIMYEACENMSWLPTLVLMMVDLIFAVLIVDLMKKNQDKNIYEFLKNTVGPFLAKIFLIIFAVKYILVLANIGKGLELFILENLYEELGWVIFGIPLVVLSSFMVYKGARNICRVIEFCFWLIIISCIYIGLKSIQGVNLTVYLPLFKDGFAPVATAGFTHLNWFGSSTFLFMFFGMVNFEDYKKSSIIKYAIWAILIVQFLMFIFYGLFEITSPVHQFALSDISQYVSGKTTISELSWMLVCVWIIGLLLSFSLYGYVLAQASKYLFNIKNDVIPVLIIILYIVMWGILYEMTINPEFIFFSDFASWTTIISEYILTLILIFANWMKTNHERRQT